MSAWPPAAREPVTSVAEAIARMEEIDAELPAADGVACFNRMYLDVTRQVAADIGTGFFTDPGFMTRLDITFADLYFAAADAAADPDAVPLAWRPLIELRAEPGIEPIQFALAGMNAHINHDLPVALARTCAALRTAPDAGSHRADYEKVDRVLDAAEQSIRRSFETEAERAADRHLAAVASLIASWTIGSARDLAWTNGLLLWETRDLPPARDLVADSLAATAASASRMLLVSL